MTVKAKAPKVGEYNSDSIDTLRFPDSIRKNPSMYIGGTDAHGMFVVLRELCDNFVDEFLAGRNKLGGIVVDKDGSYWVQDSGAGIPQGMKDLKIQVGTKTITSKMPTMQAVFGELHTSGKFRSEAYKVSIGSHGVGVKGTNATADFLDVVTCFKGKWYKVGFKRGVITTQVQPAKAPKSPITNKPMTVGTLIHFKPDQSIFSVRTFPPSMLVEWAEIQSYLNPGLKILVDVRGKQKTFLSKEGPKELIAKRLVALDAASEPDLFEFNSDLAQAVISFSNANGMEVKGYTNGLANSQGGKHVDSVVASLYEAIKPYMTGVKKVKEDGKVKTKYPFTARDFADGMLGIVNAKLHKAQFSSQDKAKLVDDRMGQDFRLLVLTEAKKFYAANKAMAKRVCDRATKINELQSKFTASKAVATALRKVKGSGLPPDYTPCARGTPVAKRELFIVEGESAGGGFRAVRETWQALLPLTGKIMNAMKTKGDKALLSKAILNILAAIGFDPKAKDPMAKLQVGKIILLADPDPDGRHINCLLNALFVKYLPGLYEAGMVYVADMPEFYSIKGDRLFIGNTVVEVETKLKAAGVKAEVHHAKGWGEVDAEVLYILAVSGARKLVKLQPLSPNDFQVFSSLMGNLMDGDDSEGDPDDQSPKRQAVRKVAAKKTFPAKKVVARKKVAA